MDYATKFILIAIVGITFFLLLTQYDLLRNLLDGILNIAESVIVPIKNLLGNLI